ncbi:MAG: hypothetical protein GX946_10460 [Oligosphaeraceae bacterium]|nr:hypothetical protein [Oligosphaeraceae bacterium]
MPAIFQISQIAWVLPGSIAGGSALPDESVYLGNDAQANAELLKFSAKPYLDSVKGYLDPGGHLALAACSLLRKSSAWLQGESAPAADIGLVSLSRFGGASSGFYFFAQMEQKGPRLASPMIFPHSYASSAGNLAAIEFAWSGAHMVYFGKQDCRETLEYAAARLTQGSIEAMVILVYEAVPAQLMPAERKILNGAIAMLMMKSCPEAAALRFNLPQLRQMQPVYSEEGSLQDMLKMLQQLKNITEDK